MSALAWDKARVAAHEAGAAKPVDPVEVPLDEADGATLATPLRARTDLPAFPTSSVDGWATRGPAPWRVAGRILAGAGADPLTQDGTCVEIATGAMVPEGTEQIVRIEDATRTADGRITGSARPAKEWREQGEEARNGEVLFAAGTIVTPGLIGLAASCGYDTLSVRRPRTAVLVFGDELLTSGLPGAGRVRDSLGPSLPAWLRRLGATTIHVKHVEDTLDAHVAAIKEAVDTADLVCTTGGTMHGPVDHLHQALAELGAGYVVNTVEVRPGFPMLLASVGRTLVAGLPGNPQSAIVALLSLAAPALAGLAGRPLPDHATVRLAADIAGRGGYTHLALVDAQGRAASHVGSSMLRGLAGAVGFAVIPPGSAGAAGDEASLVPLPLIVGSPSSPGTAKSAPPPATTVSRRSAEAAPLTGVGGSAGSPSSPGTAKGAPPPATTVSRRSAEAAPLTGVGGSAGSPSSPGTAKGAPPPATTVSRRSAEAAPLMDGERP